MYGRGGLAEYPGYYCYDAGRPSWLPYWLDTLGEEVCKFKAIPGNVASCLNPLRTDCAPDSMVNLNAQSGTPNLDPAVSGAGILPADTPVEMTNTPVSPRQDYLPVALAIGAVALFSFLRR